MAEASDMSRSAEAQDRIIMALDVATREKALDLVDELEGQVSFFKVGYQLFVAEGMAVVRELQERGKKVFLDLKMDDVGATIALAVKEIARHQVSLLTLHGNAATVRAALQGRGPSPWPKILSLTLLTSLDTTDVQDLGLLGAHAKCKTLGEYVDWRAAQAVVAGCDGLIAAGENVARLRSQHPDTLIVTPGVRLQGSAVDDHKRSTTPCQAIVAGSDYLVVGRPIRDAEKGQRAPMAQRIAEEIQRGLEDRRRQPATG